MTKSYPLEPIINRIISPFENFTRRASAGGIVLIGATILTLLIAHSRWGEAVSHFWEVHFQIGVGNMWVLSKSMHQWVNDGLMGLFFLLVGLELKREVLVGELSSLKDAALPIVAALGGMIVPALIYMIFNAGTSTAAGWAIPTATDIAFAIGILVLLTWRIPKNLILFLTALAIADDLGAVLIIALFYTQDIQFTALGAVAILMLILTVLNRGGIRHPLPYGVVGLLLWYAVLLSGVHATLAGILLALAIPARPAVTGKQLNDRITGLQEWFNDHPHKADGDALSNDSVASLAENIGNVAVRAQSPLQRIEHTLSPWVTFFILPLFAFANAGIQLTSIPWAESLLAPVTLGVAGGLVLGKFIGISLFSWLGVRLGIGRLPADVQWRHLLGAAWLGGIGFTMSLFINELAFAKSQLADEAKLGILLASLVAAIIGLTWLYLAAPKRRED